MFQMLSDLPRQKNLLCPQNEAFPYWGTEEHVPWGSCGPQDLTLTPLDLAAPHSLLSMQQECQEFSNCHVFALKVLSTKDALLTHLPPADTALGARGGVQCTPISLVRGTAPSCPSPVLWPSMLPLNMCFILLVIYWPISLHDNLLENRKFSTWHLRSTRLHTHSSSKISVWGIDSSESFYLKQLFTERSLQLNFIIIILFSWYLKLILRTF